MENKLYVGNLAFTTTDEDVQILFGQAGVVKSVSVIKDRETGRSRGFAFVEMDTADAAQEAISQFNGIQFQGRQIKVNIARPREDRPRKKFNEGRRGGRSRGGYMDGEPEEY